MTTVLTAPATIDRAMPTLAVKAIAVGACAALGLRLDVLKGLTPGLLVMVVLAPVWWPQLRASRLTRALVVGTALALLSGAVLAWLVKEQRGVDWRLATSFAANAALACAGLVVLLWARTIISVSAAVASVTVGYLVYWALVPGLWIDNPWKFAFARPVTVLVLLAVVWVARRTGRPRPGLTVVVLGLLALVGLRFDMRSEAGFLVLVAILTVWQAVAVGTRRRLRAASPVLLIVTLAVAVYLVATQLFVSGALGLEIQQRSTAQIEASGSLLLGGRPEWSATIQLMAARPHGYGLGVLANSQDVQLADNGFASINVDPATGYEAYITKFMTNDGFHLHSVAADLWAATGPVGLLLAVLVLGVLVWGLSSSLAVGRAEPLLIYIAVNAVWDIAFSPLFTALPDLLLGLFLAVVSLEHARSLRASAGAVPVPPSAPVPTPARPVTPVSAPGPRGSVLYGAAASSSLRIGGRRGHH